MKPIALVESIGAVSDRAEDHPAVCAWTKLGPPFRKPNSVEVLKQKNKSAIFRLNGVGPRGSAVVAKKCLTETAVIEHRIYEEVLPRLPVPSLRCFGFAADVDPNFRWLFIEDAGSEPYSPSNPEHCALLSRWLGHLHVQGAGINPKGLPPRGPDHYLEHLRSAGAQINASRSNPALTADDFALLERILRQSQLVESKWQEITELCQSMEQTFVHGDLKEENICVRRRKNWLEILPFDWETAGWGLPAPDWIKCPDLSIYRSVVGERWFGLEKKEGERWLGIGILFRTMAGIHWESPRLDFEWLERPRRTLAIYHAKMEETLLALGMN